MAQERGSAHVAATLVVMMISMAMLFQCDLAEAASKNVDWTFGVVNSYPNGLTVKKGDQVVFNYPSSQHNLVEVTSQQYLSCRTKATPTNTHTVTFNKKGTRYFICSIAGHCNNGMKIKVNIN